MKEEVVDLPLVIIKNDGDIFENIEDMGDKLQSFIKQAFKNAPANAISAKIGLAGSGVDLLDKINSGNAKIGDYFQAGGDLVISLTLPISMLPQARAIQTAGFITSGFGSFLNYLDNKGINYETLENKMKDFFDTFGKQKNPNVFRKNNLQSVASDISILQVSSKAKDEYNGWDGDSVKENLENLLASTDANKYWYISGEDDERLSIILLFENDIEDAIDTLISALSMDPIGIYSDIMLKLERAKSRLIF